MLLIFGWVQSQSLFAADFRQDPIPKSDKKQRVEKLIEQLGLSASLEPISHNIVNNTAHLWSMLISLLSL